MLTYVINVLVLKRASLVGNGIGLSAYGALACLCAVNAAGSIVVAFVITVGMIEHRAVVGSRLCLTAGGAGACFGAVLGAGCVVVAYVITEGVCTSGTANGTVKVTAIGVSELGILDLAILLSAALTAGAVLGAVLGTGCVIVSYVLTPFVLAAVAADLTYGIGAVNVLSLGIFYLYGFLIAASRTSAGLGSVLGTGSVVVAYIITVGVSGLTVIVGLSLLLTALLAGTGLSAVLCTGSVLIAYVATPFVLAAVAADLTYGVCAILMTESCVGDLLALYLTALGAGVALGAILGTGRIIIVYVLTVGVCTNGTAGGANGIDVAVTESGILRGNGLASAAKSTSVGLGAVLCTGRVIIVSCLTEGMLTGSAAFGTGSVDRCAVAMRKLRNGRILIFVGASLTGVKRVTLCHAGGSGYVSGILVTECRDSGKLNILANGARLLGFAVGSTGSLLLYDCDTVLMLTVSLEGLLLGSGANGALIAIVSALVTGRRNSTDKLIIVIRKRSVVVLIGLLAFGVLTGVESISRSFAGSGNYGFLEIVTGSGMSKIVVSLNNAALLTLGKCVTACDTGLKEGSGIGESVTELSAILLGSITDDRVEGEVIGLEGSVSVSVGSADLIYRTVLLNVPYGDIIGVLVVSKLIRNGNCYHTVLKGGITLAYAEVVDLIVTYLVLLFLGKTELCIVLIDSLDLDLLILDLTDVAGAEVDSSVRATYLNHTAGGVKSVLVEITLNVIGLDNALGSAALAYRT